MENEMIAPNAAIFSQHLRNEQVSIEVCAPHMISDRALGIVIERVFEPANGSLDQEIFVHRRVIIPAGPLPEQPELVIGRGSGPPNPPAPEIVPAGNFKARRPFRGGRPDRFKDFIPELCAHPLVAVQDQDPWTDGPVNSDVLLRPEPEPFLQIDVRSVPPGNFRRPIVTAGVDHNDFVRPANRLEAGPYFFLFIAGDHHHREPAPVILYSHGARPLCKNADSTSGFYGGRAGESFRPVWP